jgi:hypothetical protein
MNLKKLKTSSKIILFLTIFFTIFGTIRIYFIFNPYFPPPLSLASGEPIIERIEQACHPIDLLCFILPLRITAPTEAIVGGYYSITYDILSETSGYEQWYTDHIIGSTWRTINDCNFEATVIAPNGASKTSNANFEYSGAVGYYARTIWSFTQVGTYNFNWRVTCISTQGTTNRFIVDSGQGSFPVTTEDPVCGNGVCEEPYECPANQVCQSICQADCGIAPTNFCGDGICNIGETYGNCPNDCQTCGNGVCNTGETTTNCPSDCISGPTCTLTAGDCNDGNPCTTDTVNYAQCRCDHTAINALSVSGCSGIQDCSRYICRVGSCVIEPITGCVGAYCGDGLCQSTENSITCIQDCPNPCLNVICPDECSIDLRYLKTEGTCEVISGLPVCNYTSSTQCLMGCDTQSINCIGTTCLSNLECDDSNECTIDSCLNGICSHKSIINCGTFTCEIGELNIIGYCTNYVTLIISLIIISSSIAVIIALIKKRRR